jgi:hypothetical protein
MLILKWLPDWIFYVTLLIGVVGFLATYLLRYFPIPQLFMYKTPIQLVSVCLIVLGTFMSGAIHDNNAWLARVKEMEDKVAKAEQESKEANDKINEMVDNTKTKIVEKQVILKQYVDREIVKYDNTCVIPKEFIDVYNKATDDVRK